MKASSRPGLTAFGWSVLAVLTTASCSNDPFGGTACTLIGCADGFFVDFTPNSSWSSGGYEFVVTLDGEATTCTGSLPLPACNSGSALTCSPASSQISIGESGCALPASAHGFAGLTVTPPNPANVELKISRDGTVLAEQSWQVSYQTLQPNGPGCDPTCTSANETLSVPMDP